jgi:hypothetical protein
MFLLLLLIIVCYARLRGGGEYYAMAVNLTEYGTLNTTLSPDCYYLNLCDNDNND